MKNIIKCIALIGILAAPFVIATPALAQFQNVGSIDFPTSASGEAQQHFLRGVAILHSFGWEQAREQFNAAQEIDPDFAMAYWGESLTYNHPLVSQMDATDPSATLARLAPTREARLAKAPTPREKGFLNAVEILWGDGDHVDRRVGYMEAMEALYEAYPEDAEVAAFYSLSMLSAVAATRDLSQRLNVRAGDIALRLNRDNPDHPGAVHYIIHSFDNPLMAPLALDAAYRFAEIAPAVSHARHMPTHIFIQHGMWELVSGHNQSAYDAARELWKPGQSMGDAVHSLDWGQYGDLQLGDYEKARLWIDRINTMSTEGGFSEGGARGQAGQARAVNTVSLTQNRYTVETEEWSIQEVTEASPDHELLATALSAYHLMDQEALRSAEQELKRRVDAGEQGGYTEIMANQASALLHAQMNHPDVAIGFFEDAIEIITPMAPPRGSANPIKPLFEMYGEILVDLGRYEDAIAQFETSLLRMPNRPRSLLGMARAQSGTGQVAAASEYYRALLDVWEGKDNLDGVREAEAYLADEQNNNW